MKGSHIAIKSGIEGGNAIYHHLIQPQSWEKSEVAEQYESNLKKSWVWDELYESRNFRNGFTSLSSGLLYGGVFRFLNGK